MIESEWYRRYQNDLTSTNHADNVVSKVEECAMSRKAKGKRPVYFEDPETDKLLAMLMAVVAELAVVRDRLDTVERLAEARGVFTRAQIEQYRPNVQAEIDRERWRREYLERVLRVVHHELEAVERGETAEAYQKAIAVVASP